MDPFEKILVAAAARAPLVRDLRARCEAIHEGTNIGQVMVGGYGMRLALIFHVGGPTEYLLHLPAEEPNAS